MGIQLDAKGIGYGCDVTHLGQTAHIAYIRLRDVEGITFEGLANS